MERLATKHAQERIMVGDLETVESRGHIRRSIFGETYLEDHDTAKTALAICHRDEDKTEDVGQGEDIRTEEAAMIKAAAR